MSFLNKASKQRGFLSLFYMRLFSISVYILSLLFDLSEFSGNSSGEEMLGKAVNTGTI